jgi:hypothetical protein
MIDPFVPFSVRSHLVDAIMFPGSVTPQFLSSDGMKEDFNHWQVRAALVMVEQEAKRSPIFSRWLAQVAASGMEARQGGDAKQAPSSDDSPAPQEDAQNG